MLDVGPQASGLLSADGLWIATEHVRAHVDSFPRQRMSRMDCPDTQLSLLAPLDTRDNPQGLSVSTTMVQNVAIEHWPRNGLRSWWFAWCEALVKTNELLPTESLINAPRAFCPLRLGQRRRCSLQNKDESVAALVGRQGGWRMSAGPESGEKESMIWETAQMKWKVDRGAERDRQTRIACPSMRSTYCYLTSCICWRKAGCSLLRKNGVATRAFYRSLCAYWEVITPSTMLASTRLLCGGALLRRR